jgi:cyclopropane-fatty-acyl-phospholipid synthase
MTDATTGMKGGGYYDAHDEYQRDVAASGAGLVTACVDAVPLPGDDATFVIADYGASTGANSIASATTAARAVRARGATQPIAVLHNDLPTNDWNALFHNLAAATDSYLTLDGGAALPLVSAISFFEPAAPRGSVHLGLSSSAAHWLRHQPDVVVPEGFYFSEATGAARAALQHAADTDWRAFLAARAADLAPGGRLLVQMVGTESGPDGEHVTARRLLQAMAAVAHDMVDAGALDAGAVDRYVLAVYARTPAEARAPLDESPLREQFDVVECRTDPVANPYFTTWQHDHDAQAYARAYAAFVRGFTESSLRTNLFEPGALGASADERLDEFFTRLTARFAADPERDRFEDWTLTVVLSRRPAG